MTVPERFTGRGLDPLWTELHRRLSSGGKVVRVTVSGLDEEQQQALADLLGLDRYPGPTCTVELARLEYLLGRDVRELTEALKGPVGDRAADRARRIRERADLRNWYLSHPVVMAEPALADLDVLRPGRVLAERALEVLAALPAEGEPLPLIATRHAGGPHALDDGSPLSGLVLRALALLRGLPEPADAEARRALWESAGVACDGLSTTVLVTALRPSGDDRLARSLRLWDSVPSVITLDQLRAAPLWPSAPAEVWIVENPAILALSHRRYADRTPPMVCSAGWPNSAVLLLLRRLVAAGSRLRYHGDFDGPGLRITAHILSRVPASPWRMSARDYLDAADSINLTATPGPVPETPWDPALAPALRDRNRAVPEEAVADLLLADLA